MSFIGIHEVFMPAHDQIDLWQADLEILWTVRNWYFKHWLVLRKVCHKWRHSVAHAVDAGVINRWHNWCSYFVPDPLGLHSGLAQGQSTHPKVIDQGTSWGVFTIRSASRHRCIKCSICCKTSSAVTSVWPWLDLMPSRMSLSRIPSLAESRCRYMMVR